MKIEMNEEQLDAIRHILVNPVTEGDSYLLEIGEGHDPDESRALGESLNQAIAAASHEEKQN